MENPNINYDQMVTIPLKEYDRLRDQADANRLMFDRMIMIERNFMDLERRMADLEIKR